LTIEPEQYARLAANLELYAAWCLKIRPKAGGLANFQFNSAQRYLHGQLEAQLKRRGRVRALVLKGRQMGISTLIAARFFHAVTNRRGCRARILAHRLDATDHLFGIVGRFFENCDPDLKPHAAASNTKELFFDGLDSGYLVSSAGGKEIGRGDTVQLLHGSEVAFWPNASEHVEGLGQSIADAPGTEVILESTACGIGNLFHSLWVAAENGDSEFEPVFLPWSIHEEYRATPPAGWQMPEEFKDYAAAYQLDPAQVYWYWLKNRDLALTISGSPDRISYKARQEYPASASEAFQASGDESFIPPDRVACARKATVAGFGSIILGCDPARGGKDKTALVSRQGRRLGEHVMMAVDDPDLMSVAGLIVRKIDALRPKGLTKVVVDITGLGAGLYDRLVEMGYQGIVEPINFASKAHEPDRYVNRKAEIWDKMREWFDDPAGVQIPDSDPLHRDLCSIVHGRGATRFDSSGRLVLESKDHVRERCNLSPDLGDASALTFAVDANTMDMSSPGERYRGRNSHFKGSESWLGN
jgi:hypothetical protein